MLEGILVDLVPHGERFSAVERGWINSEASFWADAGDRPVWSQAFYEREMASRQERPSPSVHFGIQTKNGTPIGEIGIGDMHVHHRVAMIGAMIGDPQYWGGGYGTDALLLIVDYAFHWHDMRKLWLATMSPNVRVQRQMDKVGFKLETRQRQATWIDGAWADALTYGLLREEWPGREAMIEKLGLRARQGE